jgi:hypothetical protein
MKTLKERRSAWNSSQRELRRLLESGEDHEKALALFLSQHAQLHSMSMPGTEDWSYEDELLDGIKETQFRDIPPRGEHSIAWVVWHIARIEDMTMNLLVAGGEQVLGQGNWMQQLNSPIEHSGNEMSHTEVVELSAALDLAALRAYRKAVGQQTREVVRDLKAEDMARKTAPERLERIWAEKAVLPAAKAIVDYWSRRTVTGLLLMPPTRHLFIHLNEAWEIKRKLS